MARRRGAGARETVEHAEDREAGRTVSVAILFGLLRERLGQAAICAARDTPTPLTLSTNVPLKKILLFWTKVSRCLACLGVRQRDTLET
jgi:hypothetical protein